MNTRWLTTLVLSCALTAAASACSSNSGKTASKEVHLDYAYYNPLSLVVRDQHLLENKGYLVRWVLSAGSNKANEGLRSNALDLGSTAGSAALVARSNGAPIKVVDIYSKSEWTALVVAKNSPITSISDLKGKKIAVTKGTDPYFFLLQALATAGLTPADVEIVNLQHADGKTALERGDVAAWSGLDPFLAQTVLEHGSRIIYRNADFNSFGFLNAREDVIAKNPATVQAVIDVYKQAQVWAKDHPEQLAVLLAREAKVSPAVATDELARTDLQIDPTPGAAQISVLAKILPLALSDNDIKAESAGRNALATIVEPKFAAQRTQ